MLELGLGNVFELSFSQFKEHGSLVMYWEISHPGQYVVHSCEKNNISQ